jgi:peptidyl-prolyl cis-trans isomerase A (cyclophilin A)
MSCRSCAKTAAVLLFSITTTSISLAAEVSVCTDVGNFTIEIDETNAPQHAANFLRYVDEGFFSGTVFHRVIAGFMIQGGGHDRLLAEKPTHGAVPNESRNGLSNIRGTVAAARTQDPDSARSQFFINVVDNPRLDGDDDDWGYTVFGRVTDGMDVVDKIAALPTGPAGPYASDVPEPLVGVVSMAPINRDALDGLPIEGREAALRSAIQSAAERRDFAGSLQNIELFRASCFAMDADLLVVEARAALAEGKTTRAKASLEEYFSTANDTHPSYEQALELLEAVAPGTRPSMTRRIGDCVAPVLPGVPDGATEDMAGMLDGQSAVRAFMRESTAYLECLDDIIEDEGYSEGLRSSALIEYNRMVDTTQKLGEEFNEQVRAFRARQ